MKYLIKNVINGVSINLIEHNINPAKIKQVWTVLNEEKLFYPVQF
jgi:hypothetical protein